MRGTRIAVVASTIALSICTVGSVPAGGVITSPTLQIAGAGGSQEGGYESSAVGGGNPDGNKPCHIFEGDGDGTVPKPFLVTAGSHHGHISLHQTTRPTKAALTARSEAADGSPTGPAVPLHPRLVQVKNYRGKLTWVIKFRLKIASGQDIFPELTVYNRKNRCEFNSTAYGYHLRGA